MLFPINVYNNTKRIIENNEFRTQKHQLKEIVLSCNWMLKNGQTEDNCKQFILQHYKKASSLLEGDLQKFLDRTVEFSKKLKNYSYHKIIIYDDELQLINKLNTSIKIKKYIFLYVGLFRSFGSDKFYGQVPISDLMICAGYDRQRENDYAEISVFMRESGILKTRYIKNSKYFSVCYHELVLKHSDDCKNAYIFEDVYDMANHFDLIKSIIMCPVCKTFFEKGDFAKTDLCPACYRKKRDHDRGMVDDVELICSECGNLFVKSGQNQTDLCPACYRKKREHDWGMVDTIDATCPQCGKIFVKVGRSQTELCGECQKKNRREQAKVCMRKLRKVN